MELLFTALCSPAGVAAGARFPKEVVLGRGWALLGLFAAPEGPVFPLPGAARRDGQPCLSPASALPAFFRYLLLRVLILVVCFFFSPQAGVYIVS